MSQVEQLVFSDGERYPMLVDSESLPDFWVTLFVTVIVRPQGGQNTINGYISAIRHGLLWEEIKGRDFLSEFRKRKFLDKVDAISLRDFFILKTEDARKWHKKNGAAKVRRQLDDFPSVPRTLARVEGNTARTRYSRMVVYLEFVARSMHRTRPNVEAINKLVDEMKETLLVEKPKGSRKKISFDPNDKAPPQKVFDALLEVTRFDSPDNPFQNKAARKRNELMLNLMNETGMRGGEVLAMKLDDLDRHQRLAKVKRRHDDPDDPRRMQPVPKTAERDIPISPELTWQIREYIMNERATTPGANRHPYIFIVHRKGKFQGNPLSSGGFMDFVKAAVRKTAGIADTYDDEDLVNEITRHGFRHNFNYKLSKGFDEHNKKAKTDPELKPRNQKQMDQIRMYLNGWVDEKSAQNYDARFTKEEAEKFMREDMESQSDVIRKAKK